MAYDGLEKWVEKSGLLRPIIEYSSLIVGSRQSEYPAGSKLEAPAAASLWLIFPE